MYIRFIKVAVIQSCSMVQALAPRCQNSYSKELKKLSDRHLNAELSLKPELIQNLELGFLDTEQNLIF